MRITSSLFMQLLELQNGDTVEVDNKFYTIENNGILVGPGPLNNVEIGMLFNKDIKKVTGLTCTSIDHCKNCPIHFLDCQEAFYNEVIKDSDSLSDIAKVILKNEPEVLEVVLKKLHPLN